MRVWLDLGFERSGEMEAFALLVCEEIKHMNPLRFFPNKMLDLKLGTSFLKDA